MILKLVSNDGWLYIQCETFEIIEYSKKRQPDECEIIVFPIDHRNPENDKLLIVNNKKYYKCIDGLHGFVLNDKGQTIERL